MDNLFHGGGITAKFLSMLADVNQSTVSRIIQSKMIKPISDTSKKNQRYAVSDCRIVLSEYLSKKNPTLPDKKVHAFYNFKGGTGKTTLCYQVATHLAICGYKVLVIDADAQGHLTSSFGFVDNLSLPTLYDGLINNRDPSDLIINISEGLDLIPGNLSLTNIDLKLREIPRQEDVIKRYLGSLRADYDYIVFDCNPSMSILNRNILNFSDCLDIVCETHPYSVNGMKLMMDDLHVFFGYMDDSTLPDLFIIPNKYEDRSSASAEAMAALIKYYSNYLVPNFAVRKSEDFPKAARDQMPISFFCKSNSIAFEDICDLVKFILKYSAGNAELNRSLEAA